MIARRLVVLTVALAGAAAAGESAVAVQALGREVAEVERSIDRRFANLESGAGIARVGSTRGVYLRGYGAVFMVEVNLAPAAQVSPFRQSYSEEERRQLNLLKRQRLPELEQAARQILIDESAGLPSLPKGEKAALTVLLFHFPWEDLTELPTRLVLDAERGALDAARSGELPPDGRKGRLELTYF